MEELIEHCMYESGLTADGCWDELDDYAKKAIARFAKLLMRDFYNDASMLELRLTNRIEETEAQRDELLKALEMMLKMSKKGRFGKALAEDIARAAVAKAKGE